MLKKSAPIYIHGHPGLTKTPRPKGKKVLDEEDPEEDNEEIEEPPTPGPSRKRAPLKQKNKEVRTKGLSKTLKVSSPPEDSSSSEASSEEEEGSSETFSPYMMHQNHFVKASNFGTLTEAKMPNFQMLQKEVQLCQENKRL
jgi:hypothetical protein